MMSSCEIILKPIITETSMANATMKRYTFKVAKDANKVMIKKAVEDLFKVEVASVNTINMKSKPKRLGVHLGKTSAWKKAIVTLTESSKTIEFFDGMM